MIRQAFRVVAATALVAAVLAATGHQPAAADQLSADQAAAATWQAVPVPLGTDRKIISARIRVFGPDSALMYAGTQPVICWECSTRNQIFRWNGTAWTELVVPPHAAGGTPSYAGNSPNDQWSFSNTGNDYTFAAFQWNGSSWTERTPPGVRFQTLTAEAYGADDVWIAGWDRAGGAFNAAVGHWNGTAWTFTRLPAANKNDSPETIHKISDTEIWVAGTAYPATDTFRMSAARFDGRSWSTVAMPAGDARGNQVTGTSTDLWITGTKLTGGTGPLCGITLHSTGAGFTRSDICAPGTEGGVWYTGVVKYGADWFAGLQPRWSNDKIPGGALRKWTGSAWQSIAGPYPTTTNVDEMEPIPGGGLWVVAEGLDAAGKYAGQQMWRVTGALG